MIQADCQSIGDLQSYLFHYWLSQFELAPSPVCSSRIARIGIQISGDLVPEEASYPMNLIQAMNYYD